MADNSELLLEEIADLEETVIAYNRLFNNIAFAMEMGYQPYISIIAENKYRVYWDYKKGLGKHKICTQQEFNAVADWIKSSVEDAIARDSDAVKKMIITPEERDL